MRIKFIVIILLQILLLAGIIVYRANWVSSGERVLLRTVPVDPRDIFRGDYVSLNYEISNLNLDELGVKESFNLNEKIYVFLDKKEDGTYSASSVSKTVPTNKQFIQGRTLSETMSSRWEVTTRDDSGHTRTFYPRWFSGTNKGDVITFCIDESNNVRHFFKSDQNDNQKCSSGNPVSGAIEDIKEIKFRQLWIEYGIESYFVEEGAGKVIETARNARKLTVEVSLRKDGKGIITALFLDGVKVTP
jgi:uncharacterized membrane-anchored protein